MAGDDLCTRFLAGDAPAIEEVVRLIRAVIAHRGFFVPGEARADLAQASLLDLWRALGEAEGAPPRDLRAFARAIAYRRCVDWVRRVRPEVPLDPGRAGGAPGPAEALAARERRVLAARVVARLRASCRELFRLHAGRGLSYREIAERQGRSEKAVRNQMADCLAGARRILARMRRRARLRLAPGEAGP